MEELNVPHYRLPCSVALYIRKALAGQEPRSPKADTRRPPVAQMEVHGKADVHRSRGEGRPRAREKPGRIKKLMYAMCMLYV